MNQLRAFPLEISVAEGDAAMSPDEALRRLVASRGPRPFLLDGAADADGLGRFSYAGCAPRARFVRQHVPEVNQSTAATANHIFLPAGSPLHPGSAFAPSSPLWRELAAAVQRFSPLVSVGLLDYELGRASERLPQRAQPHGLGTAAVDFAAYDAVYRYDAQAGQADILAVDSVAASSLRERLRHPAPPLPQVDCGPFRSETDFAEYARRVCVVLEHLRAGDCYQVNLCRRLRAALPREHALAAYLRLRDVAPAPLGCYLELEPLAPDETGPILLSNTPELLLRLTSDEMRRAETRPIKGTRRRDADATVDTSLARELVQSEKDRAEHLMIVDLLRNDLGRIAEVGSVEVDGFCRLVELPTVHHLVSTIAARPSAGIGLAEILHALFPGGSITGAPKLAAMTIIDALEPMRRGPFYGAVGWLSPTDGELALCIRTAVVQRDELILAVGGGIVLDSNPEEEWAETEAKAAAFFRALGAAA